MNYNIYLQTFSARFTYEIAPVFTLMEQKVLQRSMKLVRYQLKADGIMCPGGSIANMYGMMLARYKKAPEIKEQGVNHLPPLVCFTSEGNYHSIMKAAHWLGLGTNNVRLVCIS